MLLEFSVGNFRSIKTIQTISFAATSSVSKYKEVDETNVFQATPKVRLLKTLAIYGANASGKSNFIRAIRMFLTIVDQSVIHNDLLESTIQAFVLSTETEHQPTYFQVFFKVDEIIYRYGFEANSQEIVSEWLFGTPKEREVPFFKRDFQKLDINKKQFAEARKLQNLLENKEGILRKNALLISTLAMLNNPLGVKIKQFFRDMTLLTDSTDIGMRHLTDDLLYTNASLRQKTLTMLQSADLNVSNLQINSQLKANERVGWADADIWEGKHPKQVLTFHKKFDAQQKVLSKEIAFDLEEESLGTRKFYTIIPFLLKALETGFPIILDELEAQLHPKLTKQIIEIFNDPETNPKNAQLLAVTHDTNLLSAQLFRRDQILFVEKDKYGASHLYALAEFKGVRNDASFENDYLMGRYGAVPFLNHLNFIFEP